jgi:hypothetical protein
VQNLVFFLLLGVVFALSASAVPQRPTYPAPPAPLRRTPRGPAQSLARRVDLRHLQSDADELGTRRPLYPNRQSPASAKAC